jgi:hypothetical protein
VRPIVQAKINRMTEPVPTLTFGDLKCELSRWSDENAGDFPLALKDQEFGFYRYRMGDR